MSVIGINISSLIASFWSHLYSRTDEAAPIRPARTNPEVFPATNDPDVQLFLSYIEGNEHAFRMLFEKWKLPVISYLYRSTGNRESAEELALDVFRRLHQSIQRYQPKAKFSTYLFFIARRLLINHSRQMRRKPLDFYDPHELVSISSETAYEKIFSDDDEHVLTAALRGLSENYRTPLLLTLQQGMHPCEVAAIIGKSENATRVLLHRGKQQLKNLLNP
jgi:RNA polymerase sigma-70 factor (ECF subfamily)